MKVKICGITREGDAALALSLGADFLGVICYPKSPRGVSREAARQLCHRIPAGQRVYVDVNTASDELEDFADLGFDHFQIHCDYDTHLATVASWAGTVGKDRLWLAPKWPPGEPFPEFVLDFCDTVVIDAYAADRHGGTGQTGDWGRFAELANRYPSHQFILAGGLNPQNVIDAVAATGATFIDANSGVETAPGVKDPDRLRALFRAVSSIDPQRTPPS